jgi:hypothetical protein
MDIQRRRCGAPFLASLSALAIGVLACSLLPFGLGGEDSDSEIATLEAQLQEARAEATARAERGAGSNETAEPGTLLEDDFEEDSGAFLLGSGASVQDGSLFLGPYDECAKDVANFDLPVDCMVVCQACGREISDYQMRVKFTYEEGLTEREFGVIVRLADQDLDGLLDREDYLLALGFNIFEGTWNVYMHEADKIDPWRPVSGGPAGFLQAGRMNELEITATEVGRLMEIRLNQQLLELMTGGESDPGEHVISPWMDSGSIGFIALGRGVQARFDDFILEVSP